MHLCITTVVMTKAGMMMTSDTADDWNEAQQLLVFSYVSGTCLILMMGGYGNWLLFDNKDGRVSLSPHIQHRQHGETHHFRSVHTLAKNMSPNLNSLTDAGLGFDQLLQEWEHTAYKAEGPVLYFTTTTPLDSNLNERWTLFLKAIDKKL